MAGAPNQPNLPSLQTNPAAIATPGMSQAIQNVYTQGGQAQGQANNAAMAALQRAGVAGGGEMGNALGNVAGQTAAGESSALAGLQQQQYNEQLALMNALNQTNLENYQAQSQNNIGTKDLSNGANLTDVAGAIGGANLLANLFKNGGALSGLFSGAGAAGAGDALSSAAADAAEIG